MAAASRRGLTRVPEIELALVADLVRDAGPQRAAMTLAEVNEVRGLLVTVNSDDPKMFGNSLAEEYRLLESRLGFSRDEIRTVIPHGIHASSLPLEQKKQWVTRFRSDPAWEERNSAETGAAHPTRSIKAEHWAAASPFNPF